ncbi:hypothetical protein EMIHUDRAFT_198145 [Emiliania huxleyi CCMP1516]|uniref:Uncharacterized protein n=2 Tax=Emiliania huxleyi TaxID=2903 RepID=A0A0D3IEC1_EMIH1|nr:hypothetical protein EMIHUDRAFT_198145 [Emiliania huxleyi CCMP1516]EOD09606.1 hypothetical protein EMIHUDRAFT_198145 [Emiliania huxleyi CCMP1516]|eukprot:XP_005762035.1 hypothetical protein EMIHUDRAFT_198145 [Emiliania huxleyi CCMP1516]
MAKKVTDSKITRHIDKNTTAFEHNSKTVLVNPPDGEEAHNYDQLQLMPNSGSARKAPASQTRYH